MRGLLVVAIVLAASGTTWSKPHSAQSVEDKALHYAKLHPNTETVKNEEYGDLLDGDIMVVPGKSSLEQNPLNAVTDPDLMWPDNNLYYIIDENGYTADQITLILAGIQDLQYLTRNDDNTNCVNILPWRGETDYVSVENYSGCSSYVGRIGGDQRLSLVDSCVNRHGTIMHEFLHAFGFHHEQKRYDAGGFIDINWSNIEAGYEHNFEMLTEADINLLGTAYDYGSAMHYGAYAFAIDPAIPTIIPHDENAVIGQRETLSALDIERVKIFYGCLAAEDSKYFKHLAGKTL